MKILVRLHLASAGGMHHPMQIIAQLQGRPDVMMSNASHVHKQITMVEAREAEMCELIGSA